MVDLDVEAIEILCRDESSPMDRGSLSTEANEQQQSHGLGLTSEHLKFVGIETIEFLSLLLNYIIRSRSISAVLKEGILTPFYKKGDLNYPENYRGITVTPVHLKILKRILNAGYNAIYQENQSRLQKGFTPGCSSLNAALILTECLLKDGNNKTDVYVMTLDTQKAFDVVDQNSLLGRLYLDGIHGDDWLLLRKLYSVCSSRIKWAGELFLPFNI